MSKEIKIIFSIAAVVLIGGGLLYFFQPAALAPSNSIDGTKLVRTGSHMTGSVTATVTVVEFADYECPACKAAAPNLSKLRAEYKDNPSVNFVFRHFPLPQHSKALAGATAAEAAAKQGKFWEMTDAIYEMQDAWVGNSDEQVVFIQLATDLGLSIDQFKKDNNEIVYSEIIAADKADGESLGVNSTPSIFINGDKASNYSYEYLKTRIDEKLK